MAELLDYTERRTRAEIASLPHGVYEAEGFVDTDGYTDDPVRLRARVEISADGVAFDLAGSDPQRRAPVNSTYAQTFSACAYALKCLVDPDLPVNDGFYRLVSARRAEGERHELHLAEPGRRRLGDADAPRGRHLPRAPARAAGAAAGGDEGDDVPRRVRRRRSARRTSTTASSRPSAAATAAVTAATGPTRCRRTGRTPRTRRWRRPSSTTPCASRASRSSTTPTAPGRFRGGLGLRKDFVFDRSTTFTVLADRTLAGPAGAFGGLPGKPAEYVLIRGGVETRLGAKTTIEVEAGDTISYRTCGGGGYGPPAERDRELVARDVREGKVSLERAREVYGWQAVDPDLLRGDPQRARGGDRRDGAGAEAERVLDEHQDPLGLLVRVLRRRAAGGRAGVRAAGAPRLDGGAGAEGGADVRRRQPRPRRRHRHQRPASRAAST